MSFDDSKANGAEFVQMKEGSTLTVSTILGDGALKQSPHGDKAAQPDEPRSPVYVIKEEEEDECDGSIVDDPASKVELLQNIRERGTEAKKNYDAVMLTWKKFQDSKLSDKQKGTYKQDLLSLSELLLGIMEDMSKLDLTECPTERREFIAQLHTNVVYLQGKVTDVPLRSKKSSNCCLVNVFCGCFFTKKGDRDKTAQLLHERDSAMSASKH